MCPCATSCKHAKGPFHRLDKMSFFSAWSKAMFLIALSFPLYSGEYLFQSEVKHFTSQNMQEITSVI